MPHFVYILYSVKIDKHYVGSTSNVDERLELHNHPSIFDNWTKSGIPWVLKLIIGCDSKGQALRIEKHIKKNKSRKYLENMIKYPEIIVKLKEKYA